MTDQQHPKIWHFGVSEGETNFESNLLTQTRLRRQNREGLELPPRNHQEQAKPITSNAVAGLTSNSLLMTCCVLVGFGIGRERCSGRAILGFHMQQGVVGLLTLPATMKRFALLDEMSRSQTIDTETIHFQRGHHLVMW